MNVCSSVIVPKRPVCSATIYSLHTFVYKPDPTDLAFPFAPSTFSFLDKSFLILASDKQLSPTGHKIKIFTIDISKTRQHARHHSRPSTPP